MSTQTQPSQQAADYHVRSNVPFYAGLIVLSGFYVLLIVGMLLAEVDFLFPPTDLVLLTAKNNPKKVTRLEDLNRDDLRIGLLQNGESESAQATRNLLDVFWLAGAVNRGKGEEPAFAAEKAYQLVDKVSAGKLDVAVVSQRAANDAKLVLLVLKNNPKAASNLKELVASHVRVGLLDPKSSKAGQRSQAWLRALHTARNGANHQEFAAVHSANPQDVLENVRNAKVDVAILPAKFVDSDAESVRAIELVEAVPIDLTSYPNHVSWVWFPIWWTRIKLWALLAPLASEEIRYALRLSLISCTITTILSLWVAVPFGYLMSRHNFRGKTIIDAILDIPIVLPPLVIGLALLILFQTSLGQWVENNLLDVTFAIPSVILAQFAVACAFAVRTMRVTFDQISPRQEEVALTLGCSKGQAFWKVVLPDARRGMVTAATLAWARALGEFGPILVFSGATRMRTEVLPTTVFLELSVGNVEAAVAVSMLMIVAAAIVLIIVRVYGLEKTPMQIK